MLIMNKPLSKTVSNLDIVQDFSIDETCLQLYRIFQKCSVHLDDEQLGSNWNECYEVVDVSFDSEKISDIVQLVQQKN